MTTDALLIVGDESARTGSILRELTSLDGLEVRHVGPVEDARDHLDEGLPTPVVVVPGSRDNAPRVAGLIGRCLDQQGLWPVVVVTDVYDQDEALMYFRLGATDYLGLNDHRDRVASVIASLFRYNPPEARGPKRSKAARAERARKARPSSKA